MRQWRLLSALFALLLWLVAPAASAQHSHVPRLDAKTAPVFPEPVGYVLDTSSTWMSVAYPHGAGIEERVRPVLAEMAAFRDDLRAQLGTNVLTDVKVRIARSPEDMAALAPAALAPPSYATAVSYTGLHTVLVSLRAPRTNQGTDLGETLKHELVHVAIDDAFGAYQVPHWFNEGMAILASGEGSLTRRQTLLDASAMHRLIPIGDLDPQFADGAANVDLAYAESGDFLRFLRREPARFQSLITRAQSGEVFDRALNNAYATDLRTLDFQWKTEVEKATDWMPGVLTGSFMWAIAAIILMLGYVRRKFRDRRVRAGWDHEEEVLAARAKAAEVFAAEDYVPAQHMPAIPRVEHDGNWHTLH
jgi:Peptidase MA superfamily